MAGNPNDEHGQLSINTVQQDAFRLAASQRWRRALHKHNWQWQFVAAALSLFCFQAEASASAQADALSTEVIRGEIEFHHLITEMRLKNSIGTISKRRRQFLWSIGNSMPTEAGLIDAMQLFFSHSDYLNEFYRNKQDELQVRGVPNQVSGNANAGQLYPQIIGQEINGAGDAFELTKIQLMRARCIRTNIDPKRALLRAKKLLSRMDNALQARCACVNRLDAGSAEYQAEGAVLLDLRTMLLKHFRNAYIDARKEYAWQNSLETIGVARNAIGALGNQISVHAGYSHNSRLNGLGNLLSELAAIGIIMRPWVSLELSKLDGYFARKQLNRLLPDDLIGWTVDTDLVRLRQLLQQNKSTVMGNRLDSINVEAQLITADLQDFEQQQSLDKARARMELLRNTVYGPTKMSNSLLGMIVGYDTHLNATEKNRLSASGSLTYVVGQGANLMEMWRERVVDELEEHKLEKQGKTREQILSSRIATLEALSRKLSN